MSDIPIYLAGAVGGGDEWQRHPECPECGEWLLAPGGDTTARCECGQCLWIAVDGDADDDGRPFGLYKVTRDDPPDDRDIEGDLRYHGGL